MNTTCEKKAKDGFYISSFTCQFSGETVYQVCDDVGLVRSTIFEAELASWLAA